MTDHTNNTAPAPRSGQAEAPRSGQAEVPRSGQAEAGRPGKWSSFFREFRLNGLLYVMALPAVLFFLIFNYLPIGGVLIAFKDFNFQQGIWGSPWSGFRNFEYFITNPNFVKIVRNTLLLNALFIASGIVFQVGIALLLNEVVVKPFKRVAQSLMIFPYFISYIVVGVIIYNLFNSQLGVANKLFEAIGLQPVGWYSNPEAWLPILVLIQVWKNTGFGMIVYLAAIASIDPELYEAATIDGAGRFQQARSITLPAIMPVIVILFILSVGRIFSTDAGMIWAIIGDNALIFEYTDTIDTYVFRNMRTNPNLGMTTAIGLAQSLIAFLLVLFSNRVARRAYPEGKLF